MGINLSGYVALIAAKSWANGNGTSDKHSGNFPVYPNGEACVLTSYNAAEGYLHPEGYIEHNTNKGYILTPYSGSITNGLIFTVSFRWVHKATSTYTFYPYYAFDGANAFNYARIVESGGSHTAVLDIGGVAPGYARAESSTFALTNGTTYTMHFVKNGANLSIFLNGVQLTYTTLTTYSAGNVTLTQKIGLCGNAATANQFLGRLIYCGINSTAFNAARCLAEHNDGDDLGGLVGRNTGNTMALLQKSVVAYNANGGAGTIASDDAIETDTYTVKANTFTRAGYNFTGFNTAAAGTGTARAPGSTFVMGTADVTLYAQWAAAASGRSGLSCGLGIGL